MLYGWCVTQDNRFRLTFMKHKYLSCQKAGTGQALLVPAAIVSEDPHRSVLQVRHHNCGIDNLLFNCPWAGGWGQVMVMSLGL